MTANPEFAFAVYVKRDCPTCRLIEPILIELASAGATIYSQDDPHFPAGIRVTDDAELEHSWRNNIDIVPTLIRYDDGVEQQRTYGWDKAAWRKLTRAAMLGDALPDFQPGCGSLSEAPGIPTALTLKYGGAVLASRQVELDKAMDPGEAFYDHGWSDGLPIIAPTDTRVANMLTGTSRAPAEVVGLIPPNLVECTVEKVAINAVMAGCRPEYMPVVLTALEAALEPMFSMHGLLCTTWFSGPAIIVNGPVAKRIGVNAKGNCFGQGTRANSTIGRALQLIIRNVGGGRPGEIDRAVFGHPGKVGFCFAEDESDPEWTPLHVSRGLAADSSAVTLFHADGVHAVRGHRARNATELTATLALGLHSVCHPKLYGWSGAILAISPDHYAIYQRESWARADIEAGLVEALRRPGSELIEGAGGIAEGIAPERADEVVDKFHPGALLVVRAGGSGALLSAVIGGWAAMRRPHEVQPITREIS
jgi:hypothetical protein